MFFMVRIICMSVLAFCMQGMVEEFLGKLAEQKDENLRFLGMRLNYNKHYKAEDYINF